MGTKETIEVVIQLAVDADAQHDNPIRRYARAMLTIDHAMVVLNGQTP